MELEQTEVGGVPVAQGDKSLMDVETARAVAQIQGSMAIAKRFPRDEVQAMNRIKQAAQRRKLAEAAEYEYKRGGSLVSGPSIRAAEAIKQAWGNIISGVTEVKRDSMKRESTMLAFAGDLESNTWKFLEFTVPHVRDKSDGAVALNSSRDVYERTMNDGSRRERNCILAVVPGDVTETFLEECNKTLSKSDTPLKDRITSMLKAMEEVAVTRAMIENTFGCKADAITERQLSQLRRIYQSLKDGFGNVGDYFKLPQDHGGKASDLNSRVKAATPVPAKKAEPEPTVEKQTLREPEKQDTFDNFQGGPVNPHSIK